MDGRPALPTHTQHPATRAHTLPGRLRRTDTNVLLGDVQQTEDRCSHGEQQPSVSGFSVPADSVGMRAA
jgi:hypothetical protein